MIHSIFDPSFTAYGCIRQDSGAILSDTQPFSLTKTADLPLFCYDCDTHWDYHNGMTVLLIRDGTQTKHFYLDRPLTLYAGVCFGFYPMGNSSSIRGIRPDAEPVDTVPTPPGTSMPQPMEIFTLFRQNGKDGLYFRGEQHLPMELVYVEKGQLHNYCDGQDLILHPSELLIFGSNQWHIQYAEAQVQFLTVSFLWEGHDLSEWCNQVIPVRGDMQRILTAILQEYSQQLPEREEFFHAQLKLLLLQILRSPKNTDALRKPSPASEHSHRQIISQAQQVVSARVYQKLTVSELATAVNVSVSQLNTLFQTYLGVSPAKYITRIRLEESKVLLSNQQMSVGKVAQKLGYSSIQHFSKQFRTWFGYSPTTFAKIPR